MTAIVAIGPHNGKRGAIGADSIITANGIKWLGGRKIQVGRRFIVGSAGPLLHYNLIQNVMESATSAQNLVDLVVGELRSRNSVPIAPPPSGGVDEAWDLHMIIVDTNDSSIYHVAADCIAFPCAITDRPVSLGAGEDVAFGAAYAALLMGKSPKRAVEIAIEAAGECRIDCGGLDMIVEFG